MSGGSVARRWGVIGHDREVEQLARAIAEDRVAHAYLITGPEGVGRTTLALAFARALNCERPVSERPCGVCESCRRISRDPERHSHADVTLADLEWQAAVIGGPRGDRSRQRQRLSIEAIRWLRQDIANRPIQSRWKVQIVDDADQLSDVAPDAFLKTLEEPPSYAVIILIATSVDNVSETIRSRCQHISLGMVPRAGIERALVERGVDAERAGIAARASRGRIAEALALADDPDAALARRELLNEALEHCLDPLGRLNVSGPIAVNHTRQRDRTYALLDVYLGIWRDAILIRSGLHDLVAFPEISTQLDQFASSKGLAELHRALWATRRCIEDLDHNFQARIALNAMVMQWP